MVYTVMACIVMAYSVMAYIVMAYAVTASIVTACMSYGYNVMTQILLAGPLIFLPTPHAVPPIASGARCTRPACRALPSRGRPTML